MKFKALATGSILSTDNPFVIEQMQKSEAYEEIKDTAKQAEPKKAKPVKATE